MRKTGLRALLVAALLVLAGCAAPTSAPAGPAPSQETTQTATTERVGFEDPDRDVLGWENGYWYDESIDVNQSDGLSDAELEAYVARSMARVEHIRQLEFKETVPVEVISRDGYRQESANFSESPTSEFNRWNDQVWEALFITGERESSSTAIGNTTSSAVLGFYSPQAGEIKIVTDTPETVTIDNATLAHELVHALQDQHFDLTSERFSGQTQDGDLAIDGIVEGDASYVEKQYTERCTAGEWECVKPPAASGGSGSGSSGGAGPNLGVLLTIYQPYSDGPVYVHSLYEQGGWEAVNDAMRNPPVSSEQTIHLTDEEPVPIEFESTATNGWETFENQGEGGSDTVGEASIYAMMWYQARMNGADTINIRGLLDTNDQYDTYNYDAKPSAGWGNDRVFPYRTTGSADTEYGYVWVTEWDSEQDARQFETAYLNILRSNGIEQLDNGIYVVPDGEFNDAFRVVRDGTRVTIVNGPEPEDVDQIRPELAS
ncbi:Hvo_1808 family surface protein [Haloferax sp. DFSO60]|uniref:Hvo_1808 family surface protein n=1 Tax=Haloferax sp. DFSO60 TaxID=3388652 RepID=UPI00397C41BC